MLAEDVQREFDEIVIVQPKAFFLLIEIAVEQNFLGGNRVQIFFAQIVQGQGDQVEIVFRLFEQLLDFEHIAGIAERHVPQREAALLIDDFQHFVDIGIVEHQKAFRIADRKAVLLQNRDAKAVERVDIAGVVVAR